MTSVQPERDESSALLSLVRRTRRAGSGWSPTRLVTLVIVIGLVLTLALAWTAAELDQRNERGLLKVQTQQAAAVIGAAVLGISGPLDAALNIAEATDGDPAEFSAFMSQVTGPDRLFVSASLWDTRHGTPSVVARVGAAPESPTTAPETLAFIASSEKSPTFVVTSPGQGEVDRVAYAVGDQAQPGFVVFAERAIPPSRVVPVQSNPAFSGLDFATYLGQTTDTSALATTNVPLADLPLTGEVAQVPIPFGNSSITLVSSAHGHLGGALGRWLAWVVLVGGIALTLITAYAVAKLVRSRLRAEEDRSTIAGLYEQLDGLYGEQRTISETLQHALLPAYNPSLPTVDVASRYVAGAQGVDIGGDWYSMIRIDPERFAFVVGDVSGRGISAATLMARLRFTMRAYLLEGHPPGLVLEMCSHQIDIREDEHFATVLVGVGNLAHPRARPGERRPPRPPRRGRCAGPLRDHSTRTGSRCGSEPLRRHVMVMPEASTLLAFTDGLVERRREDIDVGLERLSCAAIGPDASVDDLVTRLVDELLGDGSEDDVALLAFRWRDRQVTTRDGQTA